MLLDDARQLKAGMLGDLLSTVTSEAVIYTLAISARALSAPTDPLRSIAIGISRKGGQHKVAIRLQRRSLLDHPILERMKKPSKGEIDIQYVGRVQSRETPKTLQKTPPSFGDRVLVGPLQNHRRDIGVLCSTSRSARNDDLVEQPCSRQREPGQSW